MPNDFPNNKTGTPQRDMPNIDTSESTAPNFGTFPTESDNGRLLDYEYYQKLFMGHHFDAFNIRIDNHRYGKDYAKLRYLSVNMAGLISRISADMLFTEPAKVKVPDGDQKFVSALWESNNMDIQSYESALNNSALGDSLFRIRVGKMEKNKKPTVIIEDVTPFIYFPDVDGFNARKRPDEEALAWTFEYENKKYLRKEIHSAGMIRNELWLMEKDKIVTQLNLGLLEEIDGVKVPEEQPTKIDKKLLIHIPNWKTGNRYFGISDYYDLDSIFYGINNRMSKIDNVLDKHTDPILLLPTGILDEHGNVNKRQLGVVEVKEGETAKPEYVVWDASLENAFKEVEKMVEFMYLTAEISPDILGLGEGVSDSGRALKFKLMRTIAKTARKRLYYNRGLKETIYTAQLLAKAWGLGVGEDELKMKGDPVMPDIIFQDGLPIDESEQVDIETRAIDAGLTSRKDAIMRIWGVDEEAGVRLAEEAKNDFSIKLPISNISGDSGANEPSGNDGDNGNDNE